MPLPVPGHLAETLRRSTVQVLVRSSRYGGNGTAVAITGNRLLTNAHVAGKGTITIESWDGRQETATVERLDAGRDLALLAVPRLDIPPVTLADSDQLKPGTAVIAVGNPLGFVGAVSSGVVHAVQPISPGGPKWIQADVRLAPGNSGGPLANFNGQVVGLNTMVTSSGLALAIPSRAIQHFLLPATSRRSLGVTVSPVQRGTRLGGLMILELTPGGAAEQASLLPGDILAAASGRQLQNVDDLQTVIDETKDAMLRLEFYRAGRTETRRVTVQLQTQRMERAA
jgi:serine protease Do